jgi:elongator complex protein 2
VNDLDWDQHQASLVTCSQDQTTRLFSQYGAGCWFEIGRPQVHGYDMNTLACLRSHSASALPSRILSGGDEKVLRLFEPPYSFVKIFNQLNPAGLQLRFSEHQTNKEIESLIGSEVKKQPLGLMNKPVLLAKPRVDDEEEEGIGPDFDPNKILSNTKGAELIEDVVEPPVEDVLMSRTLWPEQQKLYGHAFEVFCVATSHAGDCAASSSKAKEKKYAEVIIWDLSKGQTTSVPSCKLSAHNLTVVQLEFSQCD